MAKRKRTWAQDLREVSKLLRKRKDWEGHIEDSDSPDMWIECVLDEAACELENTEIQLKNLLDNLRYQP